MKRMNERIDWIKTGMKIKRLMNEAGYTTRTLALRLYISESSVKNYIYAETRTPIEVLIQMVIIFKLDKIEDILVFENEI